MSRKIIGVTVGTQLPKPNFKQNDPTKGDYIKNKPDFEGLESRVDTMSNLVGDTKVSDQIANAIVNKVDKVDGQRLITTEEADKLKALVIGENGQVGISGTVNADNVQGLTEKLALKVDKVDGKGLSTNDYTTAEKNKLAAIETGANKTVVDSALNETSTNPVQNKVVNAAISDLNTLVGNTKVSDQISDALNSHRADMNAAMDEPGHIVHRTHYSKYVATLIDNVAINTDIISANRGEFCYNDIKDYDELTVIFDGVVYECPITVKHGEESYFYAGNFQDSAPEYPFYILGYLANESVMISVGEGEHIVSVKLSEVAKKLDAKYLPDDVVAASDWSAKEGEAGHILNRTHYKEINIVDIIPSGSFELDEYAYCMTEANGRLVAGKTYVATIDGVKYERVATYDEEFEAAYIGNFEVFWGNESENPDDDAFFFMVADDGMADISLVSSDYANKTITFSVQEFTEVIHKLPLEYLDMPDMNAAEGKSGHVLNRTHYSEPEVILADNVEITTSGMYSWISYNAIKDYEEITVVYDGITYVCPITFGIDTSDNNSKYFYFGNWNNGAPEYPFIFMGYETLEYAAVTVPDGPHTLSVMAGEYVKKLDKKYLPDDIGGGVSSWNDLTDKPFYMESSEVVLLDGEFTTEYIDAYSVFGIDTAYNETLETAPEKVTMVYDGVEYKDITFTDIPDLGKVGGNLYHMNALFGTSYEDTGEPFILAVSKYGCAIMTLDTAETAHAVKLLIAGETTEKINPSCLPDGYPYVEGGTVELLPETTLTADENGEILVPTDNFVFEVGMTYAITYNGTSYTCTAVDVASLNLPDAEGLPDGSAVLGNYEATLGTGDTGEPFSILYFPGVGCMCSDLNGLTSVTVSISRTGEVVHKIDPKYLPDNIGGAWSCVEIPSRGNVIFEDYSYTPSGTSSWTTPEAPATMWTTSDASAPAFPDLEIGKTYVVNWCGADYVTTCVTNATSFGPCAMIGSKTLTEEMPFCIARQDFEGEKLTTVIGLNFANFDDPNYTVGIYDVGDETTFNRLPDACLPVTAVRKVEAQNALNAFYEAHRTHWTDDDGTVHQLDEKYIPATWLANLKQGDVVLTPETTVTSTPTSGVRITDKCNLDAFQYDPAKPYVTIGTPAVVTYDGTVYNLTLKRNVNIQSYIGNLSLYNSTKENTGEPFCLFIKHKSGTKLIEYINLYTNDTENTEHTISVTVTTFVPDKMPEEYLPDTVALKSDIENIGSANLEKLTFTGAVNAEYDGSEAKTIEIPTIPTALKNPNALTINGTSYDGSKAIGLSLMNSINPVGTGFFSMNRKADTAVGSYSHAEGGETTASGYYSHAEGQSTTASGQSSHAEGRETTASGNNSHAEGANTTASGYSSHAEGHGTTASGDYSHAEGYGTTASGTNSHAEGWYTIAGGEYSHAEGHYTKASSDSSHVQGKYNIEDTENTYVHIVGNGESGATRSNAHTLDWEGNAWYQGDVYVGSTSGTNRDEGSKKLATKEYIDIRVPAWTDADEGKFLRIVNGTPTWVSIPDAKAGEY